MLKSGLGGRQGLTETRCKQSVGSIRSSAMVSSTTTTTTTAAAATMTTESSTKSTSSAVITMQCIVIVISFMMAMAVEASVMLLMLMSGPFLLMIELVSSIRRFLCNLILPEVKKEESSTCAISGRSEETLALYNGLKED